MRINPTRFSALTAGVIRAMGWTWRMEEGGRVELSPSRKERGQRFIYTLWHRSLIAHSFAYRGLQVCVPTGTHPDAEFAAGAARRLGFLIVRGSSTHGAGGVIRAMLRFAKEERGDIAMTPDGPQGPIRRMKAGLFGLSAKLGWPMIPTVMAASSYRELGSWDRMVIPYPFARIVTLFGDPVVVSRRPDPHEVDDLCSDFERQMADLEQAATRLVKGEDPGEPQAAASQ